MRVLIISNSEWDDSNSFGNSFSNIFGNIKEIEIANIYCRPGLPNTNSCQRFFQINEKLLIQNLLNRQKPSGHVVFNQGSKKSATLSEKEQGILTFVKKKRWIIFFWLRDLIWMIGRWESKPLWDFVESFKPQLIILPIYQLNYINKLAINIKQKQNIPMVAYVSDDEYTLKQLSFSPLYWINRLVKRKWIKKAVDQCKTLYVISEIQKQDYDKSFNKDCKILFKGGDFNGIAPIKEKTNKPIKFVYTGNIGTGRYKILDAIGKAIDNINQEEIKAKLHIYSQTPLTSSMKKAIFTKKSIHFHGGVSSNQIKGIQNDSDILVHVESFQLKEGLQVRQSFSTKIVDYFQTARCIFAVGWAEAASIKYLVENDVAVVAVSKSEIEKKLLQIIEMPQLIIDYGKKAWDCGKQNHQIENIQTGLLKDLQQLVDCKN